MRDGAARRARRAARLAADGLRDERGFTTVGAALALLLALSLVLSASQVQRISSVSAEVQDVADAAALAAQNEVAEFMTVVRVCDAVVLTLSLTGVVATGLGVAALCTPPTMPFSEPLLSAGKSIFKARDTFAQKASEGLSRLEALVPFFSAANAASVAQANSSDAGGAYLALALPCPAEGGGIAIEGLEGADELSASVESQADGIRDAAACAEELAQEADEVKQRAFEHDCGANPGYCMYERASSLAGLEGSDNPLYRSVDSWSFSVALKRAQAYYRTRAATEQPEGSSVEEQARSALRQRFYEYAAEEVGEGYVNEVEGSFDASFPLLPRDTDEMRATRLYTEAAYPLTSGADGPVLHAWAGCPEAAGAQGLGSLSQMEEGGFGTCPACGFDAASLGKVAAASTSIENGFEYHYRIVAEAAQEYEDAMARLAPYADEVKEAAGGLLGECGELLDKAKGQRIEASPPGSLGSVVFVANLAAVPAVTGPASAFVSDSGSLGMRAAVSAAALLEDGADDQGDVVSSLLDGLDGGAATGALGIVLDCWSGLLRAYSDGQEALESTVEGAIGALPFASASGLGSWAAGFFSDAVAEAGLEPADLDALKPVLVNSGQVAQADGTGFAARLASLKTEALDSPASGGDVLSGIVGSAEESLVGAVEGLEDGIEVASIELFEGGPAATIRVALPPAVGEEAEGLIHQAADALRGAVASVTGVRTWR